MLSKPRFAAIPSVIGCLALSFICLALSFAVTTPALSKSCECTVCNNQECCQKIVPECKDDCSPYTWDSGDLRCEDDIEGSGPCCNGTIKEKQSRNESPVHLGVAGDLARSAARDHLAVLVALGKGQSRLRCFESGSRSKQAYCAMR